MSIQNISKIYPNNLNKIRCQNQFSLYKLARLLNTTSTQIKRLEEGERTLTLDWAIRLAKALECTPEDIIGKKIIDKDSIYKIKRSNALIIPYYKNLNNLEEQSFEIVIDKEWIRNNYGISNFNKLFLTDAPNTLASKGITKGILLLCYKTNRFIINKNIYLINKNKFIKVKYLKSYEDNQIIARVLSSITIH